jgi:hypothetical protein
MTADEHAPRAAAATNRADAYDAVDRYIEEIYDRHETQRDDIHLIVSLIGAPPATILEPFCGHGRILLPLAQAGFDVVGLDLSDRLLESLGRRVGLLDPEIRGRISYRKADVLAEEWPTGFDVVVLGGNCFYELATADEQERCIEAAAAAVGNGGHLYLDNDHMEGNLDSSWRRLGIQGESFPTGKCSDGTAVEGTCETIWYDAGKRLVRFRRTATVRSPDGRVQRREWIQQKHPPSTSEMTTWLGRHGFRIEELWGDRHRSPYSAQSPRAVFWARRLSREPDGQLYGP